MLVMYRWIAIILTPLIALWFCLRLAMGKEAGERLRERFAYPTANRPEGKLVWIHAASVGESIAIQPLLHRFLQTHPDYHCLFTTGTKSSAALMQTKLPPRAIHQFFPVDHPHVIRRFLSYWEPERVWWMESELWPTTLSMAASRCPVYLLNARMSERSFSRWQNAPQLAAQILRYFTAIFPQTTSDKERFDQLIDDANLIHNINNLKFSTLAQEQTIADEAWTDAIKDRVVWIAASTHKGEEAIVGKIHQQLKQLHPTLLTIISPRHIDRAVAIRDTLSSFNIAQRSCNDPITDDTDMYLADTFGELPFFYRHIPIALIGGSLIPIRGTAGHNPIEASRENCAVLTGPHYSNFQDIYDQLIDVHAARIVTSAEEAVQAIHQLFANRDALSVMQHHGKQFVDTQDKSVEKLLEEIAA